MKPALATATALLAVTLLAGCTEGSGSSDASSAGGAAEVAPGDPGAAPGAPGAVDPERQVVTTASASLSVDDPSDAAQQVSELVETAGGRVDERTEQAASDDDGGEADLLVRVPADALTGVLADLEDVGEVDTVSVSRSDVTASAVDLDARISALRTSVDRLQGLLAGAATTEALLSAERSLSERQEQLESLLAQRSQLADQVELSTLSVHLEPVGVTPPGGPDGFLDALGTGWRSLVTALGALVVVLGVVLPWALVAGAMAAVVLVPLRRYRRRASVAGAAPTS
ncbi:DUF4349 domain-containing protein [Modestobacter sp. I12A-02628]|uniref:DUF4349 domain-containing protein n=1 Tax=Goekera deserti TaxID=2497753 RepID=A0A7K3WH05_9ACTN|nr:DUF4349 domain-containing protein [Goekera deserti]MPQ99714.1 DUF4349 domain-containing protein [Goekera deserti]NDI46275.1 DUF4349 domain-containing protein [Goekera deserti]NEL54793.1 DUF4349 domain-containing protein [Goekera deserti]